MTNAFALIAPMGHTDESADGTLTRWIENNFESKGEEKKDSWQ